MRCMLARIHRRRWTSLTLVRRIGWAGVVAAHVVIVVDRRAGL